MIVRNGKTTHLIGRDISYIMFENEDGDLLNFHFGKKIADIDYSQMKEEWEEKWGFVSNRFCLDNYPQEYPSYGYSDLRNPAYQVVNKFGNAVSRLAVKDYIIHNECAVQTDGMPCLFNKNKKADTLEVVLYDEIIDLEVHLYYTVFDEYNIIARHTVIINKSDSDIKLLSAYSASIDLPMDDYEMIHFAGSWGRERAMHRTKLEMGMKAEVENARGGSGHQLNPFSMITSVGTDETHGEGYLRAFFNKIKAGTYSSIERCFITGVSPVTMDDLTSGFNIGTNYSLTPEFNEMIGFTEEEVREMLTYYSTNSPFRHTVDELMEIMKPWYDNYCFAQDCYGETTMYNSNMVLYFVKNYIDNGKAPREMIEDNIRIDYEKLRMLIRKDKEFAHDASVIQTLVSQGYITGELKKGFPAVNITNPDNFISLLYYFGMLTISGIDKGKTELTIPNLVVQEQLYTYLLNTYNDADLNFSSYEKSELSSQLAYDGNWQAYFSYIADCLKRYASQRDKQKGEFFVHGFTLAMTAQNRFYRPISEQDTQAGYVDIFLCPMLDIYSDMKHSYIVELKYAKYRDSENRVEELRQEAIAQANRYADTDTVKQAIGSTQLHKIVVVYKGMEMRVCEEL